MFFLLIALGVEENSSNYPQKKSILIKPRNARKKIVGNGIPKKIPFRLYKPRKSQKQKETCSKNTMGVSKKMVGFHKTTIGFSYPKDRSFWGGDWGNPPFKENTHMYLHEWLMCMVNGDISFQTTNSSTINFQGICSNFQGGNHI